MSNLRRTSIGKGLKKSAQLTGKMLKRGTRVLVLVSVSLLLLSGFRAIPITYNFTVNELMPKNKIGIALLESALTLADANDTVNITIRSPGGSVLIANNLINDVQNSDARVNMVVDGFAASAAANLMLTGDTLGFIQPDAMVVFHRPYVQVDNNNKVVTADEKGIARVDDLVMNRIIPILLPQERLDYVAGKDIWIRGDVLIFRLKLAKMVGNWPMLPSPVRLLPLT